MYCPKCKQNFDEGSRRFCPTDGARLISESASSSATQTGGVFANLIPKIDGLSELDKSAEAPTFSITDPDPASLKTEEMFFEPDDLSEKGEPEIDLFSPAKTAPSIFQAPKSVPERVARKVNPHEIPAGHVDIGDGYKAPEVFTEFNEDDPESFVGRTVKGRYKVTEFAGGDENGLAYLAEDKIHENKKVLVRILLADGQDEIINSILTEERVSLSHISHPNIARLIDSGEFTNGTNFLVSEYVDALSVKDILSIHGPFGESRAARIIRQAASALNEAHQEGILHRDLRPENLIIDASAGENEQTKVVNFGASNGEPTQLNFAYKAPEVLDGRVATVSSDIYSLALVSFRILTGQMPFAGNSVKEMIKSQTGGLTFKPSDVRPELNSDVDAVFARALAPNPAKRYAKARDFGEAFYSVLSDSAQETVTKPPVETIEPHPQLVAAPLVGNEKIKSASAVEPVAVPAATQPMWRNRSPEPPKEGNPRIKWIAAAGLTALLAVLALGWFYVVNNPPQPEVPVSSGQVPEGSSSDGSVSPAKPNTEMPPQPRNIAQPPNTNFYQNSKQNLKGDLLINFVGFTMYYPKDWKVNGPQEGSTPNARGKFIDISRSTADDRLKEQMLISYYPSKGTFAGDSEKFSQMVRETNETLKKILPGYQMVSEGPIRFNGDWRAYEVKFQGGGTSGSGEKLVVWGRRLFIPAERPGVRNGFEITMLATSLADDVRSVDDVGVKGELANILFSFEPSQNF